MELKLMSNRIGLKLIPLLIVPYGIETCVIDFEYDRVHLLIVPYGIETSWRR